MKNNVEVSGDPKYLMNNYLGVLTLNIRRPSSFDSGTYTCRAVNELGEALAECKLEVRSEHGVGPSAAPARPSPTPFTKLTGGRG